MWRTTKWLKSAIESPPLMENLATIIGFIFCKYCSRWRILSSLNWTSLHLLHRYIAKTFNKHWKYRKSRLIVEEANVLEPIMLYRHHYWANNFNAILSCTHKSSVRKIFFSLLLALRPCQNSIIEQDSFSMLQTDTLQFTQIAQTIDKLVFHLARARVCSASNKREKNLNLKLRMKIKTVSRKMRWIHSAKEVLWSKIHN